MGYPDFDDLLLEERSGSVRDAGSATRLKLSGLPHHKTLDDFDVAFQPCLDARKVRDLAPSRSSTPSPNTRAPG